MALCSKPAPGGGVMGEVACLGVLLVTAHRRNCQPPEACQEGRLEPGSKIRFLLQCLCSFLHWQSWWRKNYLKDPDPFSHSHQNAGELGAKKHQVEKQQGKQHLKEWPCIYRAGKDVHLGSSVPPCRKTRVNFLANPVHHCIPSKCFLAYIPRHRIGRYRN